MRNNQEIPHCVFIENQKENVDFNGASKSVLRKASFTMSVFQYEDYLNKLKSSQHDYKVETLRIQRKFLYSLYSHHLLWAKQTDHPETADFHTKAAGLLQESISQYDQILERYYLDSTGV